MKGNADKKYYANPILYRTAEITLDQLTEKIERISTLSSTDIHAVLYVLVDVIPANSIKSSKILFTPGEKLKTLEDNIKFEKV